MDLTKYGIDVEAEAEENRVFEPLPDGQYEVIISKSEMKETKAGDGEMLALTYEVIEGEHEGRLLWEYLNLVNKSDVAERIGRSKLASICKAVGVMAPEESDELHDKPLVITVRRDKKDNTRNTIKGYASADGTHAERVKNEPKPEPKAAPEPEKPVVKKKPWQK